MSSWTARCVLVSGIVALAAWAFAASAQPRPAQPHGPALSWVRLPGAEACIAPVELAERVAQRLGRAVFVSEADASVVVEGFVERRGAGFRALLQVVDREGKAYGSRELSLETADCRSFDPVLELVIAVTLRAEHGKSGIPLPPEVAAELDALFEDQPTAIDPGSLVQAVQPEASPSSQSRRRESRRVVDERHAARESTLAFSVGLGFGAVTGLQPDGTLGASLELGLRSRKLGGIVLGAMLGLSSHEQPSGAASPSRASVAFQALGLALGVCAPELRTPSTSLSLCGRFGAGRLRAAASGFVTAAVRNQLWLEAGPAASARAWLWQPVYAQLAVQLPIRLSRPEFAYRADTGQRVTVFTVAPVGVGAELALGAEFRGLLRAGSQKLPAPAYSPGATTRMVDATVSQRLARDASAEPSSVRAEVVPEPEFEQIFRTFCPYVARVLPRMGVASADLDDVSQEVFIAVHRALPGFERRSSLKSWVYGICIRQCSNYRRRAHRRYERAFEEADGHALAATQERGLIARRALERLDRALERLPETQRAVFVLFEIEGLEMSEIAAALGCSKFTLYARLYAARRTVEAAMQTDGGA